MIKLSNINKTYLGKDVQTVALKDIELDINKGEFVAIMGRSGCGKTTLLNILGCMDSPTQGRYSFNNEDMINRKASELAKFRNKHLGFIFQSFNLIDEMTAFENIEVPLGYAGLGRSARVERVNELLAMVGMTDRQQHRPAQLSGGQQQRVAIARALANNPELILADEPTGNLDSTNGNEIMELLKNLNDSGTTLILVTHDEVIAEYAHRRITLVDGRIESDVIK